MGDRSRAVGASHRAVPVGLVEVNEDARAALFLPPGCCDLPRHPSLEFARRGDHRVPHVEELTCRLDRCEDMQASVAGGLNEGIEAHFSEHSTQLNCRGDGVIEVGTGLRVEVDAQLIRIVGVLRPGRPRMKDDRIHLHSPDGCGRFVDHELRMRSATRIDHRHRAHEVRRSLRWVLRKELLPVDTLSETLERNRPVTVRPHEGGTDLHHVAGEVKFRDARVRPEHPRRARDTHLPHPVGSGHGQDYRLASHSSTVLAGVILRCAIRAS